MQEVSFKPVTPEPAATVVLVREKDSGIEVYITRRQDHLVFLGGYHVFPGGKQDEKDRAPETMERCRGGPEGSEKFRIPDDQVDDKPPAYLVTAIRELFEEVGVLLACDGDGRLVTGKDENLWQRLRAAREKIHDHEMSVTEMLNKEGLYYALDELIWFAHWITPAHSPRRFDTQFFLACLPEGQRASAFKKEVSDSEWIEPAAAIEKWRQGKIKIIPPTLASLDALVKYKTWAQIKDDLENRRPDD